MGLRDVRLKLIDEVEAVAMVGESCSEAIGGVVGVHACAQRLELSVSLVLMLLSRSSSLCSQ